jgi:ZIP family zinc transporter
MSALTAAAWGGLAAISLVIGAWLALRFRPDRRAVGLILGFGAGALLGAVAYELVPRDVAHARWGFVWLGLGAITFYLADRLFTNRHRTSAPTGAGASMSIVIGALLDGVPESVVLGMGLAAGGQISVAFLVAVFVSNLPESLGATPGMLASGLTRARVYQVWWAIVVLSALCAALGYAVITWVPGTDGSYVQAFAAGAVLTMLADSMIPEAYEEGGKAVGLITVLGFVIAGALSLIE